MKTRGRPRRRPGRRGTLGEGLRAARAHRGMTQHDVARELGLHPVSVARYETGSSKPTGPALAYIELWIAAASAGEEAPRAA
ncbi:MAG: transcriptional regulator with XRE-family HTH domain [Pseudohongiellaceae bacterium]|jgi:transcriptional regulator with XRE-family HTH domain